jgi:hypothetical protein
VVGVDIALSMSAWLTGFVASDPPPLLPFPLLLEQAANAAVTVAAPAADSRVRRLN